MTELVSNALGSITEGVCRPLRLRLEQVVSPEVGPAILHTLAGLIRFYLNTIGEVIRPEYPLAPFQQFFLARWFRIAL